MADDVITLLHRQHEHIRTLFAEVEATTGDERKDAWRRVAEGFAHADHEEKAEFPLLREVHDQARLERMAKAVEAAEAIAPTRPHPGVEGPVANLALGPLVAVVDKARDAIRKVLG